MNQPLLIKLARAAFVMLCCLLGIAVSLSFGAAAWLGALSGTAFALFFVFIDGLLGGVTIRGFSAATFGLMIGVLCAWLLTRMGLLETPWVQSLSNVAAFESLFQLMLYTSLGFLGMTMALRSDREEFSLIIPYVRFRQESAHDAPLLLDTNIVIDGRIPAILETGFLSGSLLVPRFVVDELQHLADSPDPVRSERGKRGLECLSSLGADDHLDFSIHEAKVEADETVDASLVQLARQLGARLLTNDQNLGKVAKLRKVEVLNFNKLANALRPEVLAGDVLEIVLVKKGKEEGQAVGYLPDGTMIVVNKSAHLLGQTVHAKVSSALQTSAGRLIFAERQKSPDEGEQKEKKRDKASAA